MAEHGIIGDQNFGTDLPQTQVEEQGLMEERKAAKFSRTAEFKKLKEHLEGRIEFYQQFLPDGREIGSSYPTAQDWIVANAIVGEFKAILGAYETARTAVEDSDGRSDT